MFYRRAHLGSPSLVSAAMDISSEAEPDEMIIGESIVHQDDVAFEDTDILVRVSPISKRVISWRTKKPLKTSLCDLLNSLFNFKGVVPTANSSPSKSMPRITRNTVNYKQLLVLREQAI
jgi:hypothetical protein